MAIKQGNTGPTSATRAAAVTPSDSADLDTTTKFIWVGGVGDLKVRMAGGDDVLFTAVPAGTLLPISVSRVYSTLTTATSILAVWE